MKNLFSIIAFLFCIIILSCNSQKSMRKDESKKLFDLYKDKMSKLISSGSLQHPQYDGIITAEIIKDDYIFHYKYDTIDYQISISHKYYSDFLPLFEWIIAS